MSINEMIMKIKLSIIVLLIVSLACSCVASGDPPLESNIDTVTSVTTEITHTDNTVADITTEETTKESITLEPIEGSRRFVTIPKAYTQAFCVSDNYIFVSYSATMGGDKNDYVIYKYDRFTGELILKGKDEVNHANGMTYNSKEDKIIVTALDGDASATTSVGPQDYSLYIVDPDTLSIDQTVNLRSIILGLIPNSVGIGAVAYSEETDNYYVLTRYPDRRIVTLTSDFKYVSDFPIVLRTDPYLYGDICCDGGRIYITLWIRYSLNNIVDIYSLDGEHIETEEVNGLTHIEGIDRRNGRFYVNFIDFNVSPAAAVICEMDELGEVN